MDDVEDRLSGAQRAAKINPVTDKFIRVSKACASATNACEGQANLLKRAPVYIPTVEKRRDVARRVSPLAKAINRFSIRTARYLTLQRRAGRTTLFVQREVPGIYSEDQDCCHKPITRLEAVDVTQWVSHKE